MEEEDPFLDETFPEQVNSAQNKKMVSEVRTMFVRKTDNWLHASSLKWLKELVPQNADNFRVRFLSGLLARFKPLQIELVPYGRLECVR